MNQNKRQTGHSAVRKTGRREQLDLPAFVCDLLYCLLFVMTVVLTLYRPDAYHDLGEAKYRVFRLCAFFVFALCLLLGPAMAVRAKKRGGSLLADLRTALCASPFSRSNRFFAALALSHILTFAFASDRPVALQGMHGWRMGFVSCMALLLLWLLFAAFFRVRNGLWGILLFVPALVSFLGILNRFGIYLDVPLIRTSRNFLSTIGNINWFAGFLSVFVPLQLAFFMTVRKRLYLILAVAGSAVFLLAALLQGSNSILFALAGTWLVLLLNAARSRFLWERFLWLNVIFGACMELTALLVNGNPRYTLQPGEASAVTLSQHHAGLLFLFAGAMLLSLSRKRKDKALPGTPVRRAALLLAGLLLLLLCAAAVILFISVGQPDAVSAFFGTDALVLTEQWGSGRGAAYRIGAMMLRSFSPAQWLFGIGQDCFFPFAASSPEISAYAAGIYQNSILTNAHCIPFTLLIQNGILGLVCAAGFLALLAKRFLAFLRTSPEQPIVLAALAALASYSLNGLFSFAQLLSTPFLFLLCGMAQAVVRDSAHTDS